ncbi:MAG: lamin tail domain-containing protein, partial [Sedimentisphaerales bacterium]|nr:lamin tail domain-containing protein [Sedimentisphaerales bacterium]
LMDDALLAIPTLSLVTDLEYLFDPIQGVYINTGNLTRLDGDSFEQPCSLELIHPDGSDGFQIDCGLRIRGGASRNTNNPKHALRFFFRSLYGTSKLEYPLFGDEGTDQFDKMDLRTAANYGWSSCWLPAHINVQNTFVRDEHSRLTHGLLGHPYTRGRYYHLYINGQYWGLYQTEERPDARFAASYMGGVKDDYDVVKPDIAVGRTVAATDGNMDAFRRLYDAIRDGIESMTEYYAVQGMNPDGTRNPACERLLDVDNLIDYMLIDYYSSDGDGAGSRFTATNNFFGIFNRTNPDGFKWVQHDSEHSFGAYEATDARRENMVTPLTTAGANFAYFNPHWLHEQLANQNREYRLRFADRAQELFFNGGLLSAGKVWQIMTGLASQIDMAIIAESARWGDATVSTPRTRDTWLEALTFLHNYIDGTSSTMSDPTANSYQNWPMQLREIRVRDQFRSVNWFPTIDAPQFGQQGGYVASNYALSITNPNSGGTIYYTLDGSDPRQAPTDEQGGTEVVFIAENAAKQVLIPTQNIYAADGTVRAETWTGISGETIASLTGSASYPDNPTKVEFWNSFQMPAIDWAEYYGTRVRALVYPPTTGSYTFWIASDDNGQLLLSADAYAANASVIASITSWVTPNTWTAYDSQKSTARTLTAGNAYYIEAIQKEHAGGDHLSIAWSGPGISGPVIIPGQYLSIPENVWAGPNYTPTGWITGSGAVGYERSPGDAVNYTSYVSSGINVEPQMFNVNTSCYIRIPFQYNGQAVTELLLKIRYDDGIIVFLNGREVARDNVAVASAPVWNTAAANYRDDNIALTQTTINLSPYINQLQVGNNVLAIQGMNNINNSSDFLISAELVGRMSIGTPSANAMAYDAPVTLSKSTRVNARVFTGFEWSTLNKATFAVGPIKESLRVTELMYHPQDPNHEFFELQNIGTETINLNQVAVDRGITYTFGDVDVAPNGFVLLVNNKALFESVYTVPAGVPVIQWTDGQLSNSGETIQLLDAAGTVIQSFAYKDSWYPQTDGDGFSLTILNPADTDLTLWSQKSGWAPSTFTGGSPGQTENPLAPGTIVINEILAHSHDNAPDWIELYNATDSPISVGGWYLSDDEANPQSYQIPDGLFVPDHGYLVLYEDEHFGSAFRLSENGEEVCLTAAVGGVLTGYTVTQEFGASETGVSFGRYQKTSGGYDFVSMVSNTPNAVNAAPLVGPVVIREIMYNPLSNGDAEYVEIQNISSQTVDLWLSDAGQVIPWRFVDEDSSILLEIPADTWLAPGEKMLLIKNLTAYQSEFGAIPAGLRYAVWSLASLSNGGERLELLKPADTLDGVRYYVRVDRVNYDDDDPWPTAPDGTGQALGRMAPSGYGNDYANWQAITPTPGQ